MTGRGRVSDAGKRPASEGGSRGHAGVTTATEDRAGTSETREPPRKKARGAGGSKGLDDDGGREGAAAGIDHFPTPAAVAGGEGDDGGACSGSFKIMGGKGEVSSRWMEDSSALWRARDVDALRAVLERDGYLLLRGILPRADVEAGRAAALHALAEEQPHLFARDNNTFDDETRRRKKTKTKNKNQGDNNEKEEEEDDDDNDGLLVPGAANLGLLSRQHIAALPEVRAVVESDELFDLAEALLECPRRDDREAPEMEENTAGGGGSPSPIPPSSSFSAPSPSSSRASDGGGAGGGGGDEGGARGGGHAGGGGAITTAYKWFRAVAGGEFTGVHTDRVFLGRGTDRLVTAWIPFGEVRVEDGSLMVARRSHRSEIFSHLRATYGASQVGGDGTRSGWLTDDAAALPSMLRRGNQIDVGGGGTAGGGGGGGDGGGSVRRIEVDWRTAHFQPGDVAVLAIDTVHMSAANCSGASCVSSAAKGGGGGAGAGAARVRVSCDTRWQPVSEPTDPRVRVWRRRVAHGGGFGGGSGSSVVDQLRVDGCEVAL